MARIDAKLPDSSNRSGFIVKGHCSLAAARLLGVESVPVDYQDYETEAAEWADR